MSKIKFVDIDSTFTTEELRQHYMSLVAYLLMGIMRNEHPVEVLSCVRLIHPHLPMARRLFKIVDESGKDMSDDVYNFIANTHDQLAKEGVLS